VKASLFFGFIVVAPHELVFGIAVKRPVADRPEIVNRPEHVRLAGVDEKITVSGECGFGFA
jgi:hypothetical protein